jgi:outer membrane protein TolC
VLAAGCAALRTAAPVGDLRQRVLPPPSFVPPDPRADLSVPLALPEPQLPLPRRLEPGADGPAAGRPAADAPPSPAADASALPELDGRTPTVEGPLSLEQAVEVALQNNPGLQVMAERVEQARAGRQIAFASFLPQADVNYRYLTADSNVDRFALPTIPSAIGNVAFGGESDKFRLAELHLQWTLWDFGRTGGKYGQAVAALDIASLQYVRARQTVIYNVTTAYLEVLAARAARIIAEEAVRRAESQLRDARNFLRRGVAIRNDLLRAEVLLAEMKLGLVRTRTAEGVAVAGLNQVLGINVSSPTQVLDRRLEPDAELDLAQCLQLAVDNRQEFGVVLRAIESSQLGRGVARADFMPRIYVGGSGFQQQTSPLANQSLLEAGLNIELSLFEGGRRLAAVRGADAEIRAAIAHGRQVCDQIAYEVNVAFLGLADARQRIDLARTAVLHGRENLRVVRSLFERGDATPTDIVDAQLALTRAEQNYSTALYDYQSALARLEYAVGVPMNYVASRTPGGF